MHIYSERLFISIGSNETLTGDLKLYVDIISGSSYLLPNSFLCISSLEKHLFIVMILIMTCKIHYPGMTHEKQYLAFHYYNKIIEANPPKTRKGLASQFQWFGSVVGWLGHFGACGR